MQTNERKDMRERFPMLTPAELDVCRLVAQGLTLKEISSALGKSFSNVSTVRVTSVRNLDWSKTTTLKRLC